MKKVAVDTICPVATNTRVLNDADGLWDATLNQTQIATNNNKYYIIQLLESTGSRPYYWVWNRWGRVGKIAGSQISIEGKDVKAAKLDFCKKFKAKTKNDWGNRQNFKAVSGKYTLLEKSYENDSDSQEEDNEQTTLRFSNLSIEKSKKSKMKTPEMKKLNRRVEDLIKLICDVKMMNYQMKEIGYDPKKLPLGKLTQNHISRAYNILQDIENELGKEEPKGSKLMDLSSTFYTLIPHDFGMKRPPVIETYDRLKEKVDMVEALSGIESANSLLKEKDCTKQYEALRCEIEPIKMSSQEWKLIESYIINTQASAKTQGYALKVVDIFEINREGESIENQIQNHKLLWHGSRLTNFASILSKGLRIAPPEAPVNGYLFGKGIYFADMISKSAMYCGSNQQNNIGLLLLCDVSLGVPQEKTDPDYSSRLPSKYQSVKALGQKYPNPKEDTPHPENHNLIIPLGKPIRNLKQTSMSHNEFIVYKVSQSKMKYLVKVQFDYQSSHRS